MKNIRPQDAFVAAAVLLLITLVLLFGPQTDVPYLSDSLADVPVSKIGIGCALVAGALIGLRAGRRTAKGDRSR